MTVGTDLGDYTSPSVTAEDLAAAANGAVTAGRRRRRALQSVSPDDVFTVIEQTSSVSSTTSGLTAITLESALCSGEIETETACTATTSISPPLLSRELIGRVPLTAPVSSISGISAQVKTTVLKTVC